jgi:hypothetical protein
MPDQLEELRSEEQALNVQLKALRVKKEMALAVIEAENALAAQAEQRELAERVQALAPVRVFGVTYDSLRKYRKATSIRFVPVHSDIRKLLIAALPASSEEQFCEMCSALVSKLMGYSPSHEAIEAIEVLRKSSDTARYFDNELHNAVVVIACDGRLQSAKHEKLSDMLTAWALSWGSATNFEDSE